MHDQIPVELEIMPDDTFTATPRRLGWPTRIFAAALGVSFVTGLIAVVAISFYILALMLPVALVLAARRASRSAAAIKLAPGAPIK